MGASLPGSFAPSFRHFLTLNSTPGALAPIIEVLFEWGILDTDSLAMSTPSGATNLREVVTELLTKKNLLSSPV